MSDKKYNYYLFPGLGFNEITFQKLELPNAKKIHYVNWIEPAHQKESLNEYFKRLAISINTHHSNIIFVGHSFGGVAALEISKWISVEKVILISSIQSKKEIPFKLKFMNTIPLYQLVNKKLIHNTFSIWGKTHDFLSSEDRKAFLEMIDDMSMSYFKWAVKAIINWKGSHYDRDDVFHIHGKKDRTLLYRLIKKVNITLNNGGHFMVFNKAKQISEIIANELNHEK